MRTINVGAFEPCTTAMGPGRRACLWVRGCSINCPGCATPEFIERTPPTLATVDDLVARIAHAAREHDLEGVSFSGGEPFEQAEALARIAAAARRIGLSVLSWSGYARNALEGPRAPQGSRELLAELDVLIDGPFLTRAATDLLPLRGSSNQRLHLLTPRYAAGDFATSRLEARIDGDDSLVVSGVADSEAMRLILHLLGV